MDPQYLLALILIAAAAAAGVWDIVCYTDRAPQNTVSNLLGIWAGEYPILTFAAGILAGHLLWPRTPVNQ